MQEGTGVHSWMQTAWERAERRGHIERLVDKISKTDADDEKRLLAYAQQLRQVAK